MRGHQEIKQRGGDEVDCFSHRSRPLLHWQSGETRKIKRGFNKRLRKAMKVDVALAEAEHQEETLLANLEKEWDAL